MVTIEHLSILKLLLAIVDVFTPVQLHNSTTNKPKSAWFNDDSVTYGVGDHFVLMMVTSVIVGIFLITYMLIILTGRLLRNLTRLENIFDQYMKLSMLLINTANNISLLLDNYC